MENTLMKPRVGWRRKLRGLALPAALLLVWELLGVYGVMDSRLFPSIGKILATAMVEFREGNLAGHVAATLVRGLSGFLIGAPLGILFGCAIGLSRVADKVVGPLFHGLRQIALLAWIPLICMWLGLGEVAKVTFVAISAFIPVSLNTYQGIRGASVQLAEVGRVLRWTRLQTIRHLYLPSACASIVDGIQLALIYAWLATIGSEYFMAIGPGIGGLILAGRDKVEMELVVIGVALLGCIGYLLSASAKHIAGAVVGTRFPRPTHLR